MLRGRATRIRTQAGDLRRRPPAIRRPTGRLRRLDFSGLSLARRYLLLSLVFVVIGGGVVAFALGQLIETSAINRTTSVTALYVESFVAPELQTLATSSDLTADQRASLQGLLTDSPLGQAVVSFRVWSTDGRVLYSPYSELIGQSFDMSGERGDAARGAVIGDISDLSDPENVYERQHWSHLIELYLPVRASGSDRVIAVAEFYQLPDELEAEVNRDRLIAWGLVAGATVLAYLALVRVVRQGSETILRQQDELRRRVDDLSLLLDQNARLSGRIRHAAARSTALTELERRRIGSDLHDGPSQSLAFAMLRLDAVESRLDATGGAGDTDLTAVRAALDDALTDMRTIAAGLRTPELEGAAPAEIVSRAVAEHERRAGIRVAVDVAGIPSDAPLASKIALYRILSEALSNAARHGGGAAVTVRATESEGALIVEVADDGPGFDPGSDPGEGHLGLAGMRERTELLGGRFELESSSRRRDAGPGVPAARRAGDGRSMSPPIRLLIVDDHPLFLDGLVATLSADEELEVVATAADAALAVRAARDHEPDIALLDVAMPGGGIEAARSIAAAVPATRVVMLTSSENEDDLLAAMEAGAKGYVLKGVAGRELRVILKAVHRGEVYVAPGLAYAMIKGLTRPRAEDPLAELTGREREVLELVAAGLSNAEIGGRLGLAEKTVKHYMTAILAKLDVGSRVEAALLAYKAGMRPPGDGSPSPDLG